MRREHAKAEAPRSKGAKRRQAQNALLRAGDSFGNNKVVSSDNEHLFIRSRPLWPILIGLTGVLALAFCVWIVWAAVSAVAAGESLTLRWRSLVGLVLLAGYGISTILVMSLAAGLSLRFDGPSRTIEERLFFGLFRKRYPAGEITEIIFRVKPPDEHKREWCAIVLPTRDPESPREIGPETADDDRAVTLLHAARHLAYLFDLPLRCEGEPRKPNPRLRRELQELPEA